MALPQLYHSLTLTSYDRIRYRDERPEGSGSASPFTMGLNALVTRSYATLVRSIALRGDWKVGDLEEHAQVGRVPDSSMLLNITVRAAVDRMTSLESFSWELNTKMLDIVYSGLTQLPRLTSLTIRFPSTRQPQPTFVLPPMPHLRCLKITEIDPLCYPDDIATMLWKSKKLRALKLHWSPRMRIAQEPSVSLHDYFRKCNAANQPLPVKKISFQNMYAFHTEEFNFAFDPTTVEDITFLSGDSASLVNTFVENSWPTVPPHRKLRMKSIRIDAVSKRNSEFLGNFKGLERLYFVNVTSAYPDYLNSARPNAGLNAVLTPPTSEHLNGTAANSPATTSSPASQQSPALGVRDSYLANITMNHGASLRHLLLSSKWPLSTNMVARLVHSCPNLEQLGLATEFSSMESLGMLVPFLRNLVALRLLIPAGSPAPNSSPPNKGTGEAPFKPSKNFAFTDTSMKFSKEVEEAILNARSLADIVDLDDEQLIQMMSYDLAEKQVFGKLKIVGMGWKAFELREFYKTSIPENLQPGSHSPDSSATENPSPNVFPDTSAGVETGSTNRHLASQSVSPAVYPNSSEARRISSPATVAFSAPPKVNLPPSTLGKRTRDDDEETNGRLSHPPESRPSPGYRDLGFSNHGCSALVITEDGQVVRRGMRRAGWEVLQNWEIWALDAQEI